jgi:uncharacterized delta-60 repeat protein
VLPQPDGRIVVVGLEQRMFLSRVDQTPHTVVARYEADGQLDVTFGTNGMVVTTLDGFSANRASAAVLQPDGKVVVAGNATRREQGFIPIGDPPKLLLMRFNTDGVLDRTFGGGDGVVLNSSAAVGDIVQGPNGSIVVAGQRSSAGAQGRFAVFRFKQTGSLDRSFAGGGTASVRVLPKSESANENGFASDVAVQPDGHVLSSGRASATQAVVVRLLPNGRPDPDFGNAGVVLTEAPNGAAFSDVLAPADGTILTATPDAAALRFTRYMGFTVKPFATLARGTLRITGTDADDDTQVTAGSSASELVVAQNGLEQTFAATDVKRIEIDLRAGDDTFAVATDVTIPADVRGGDGNDTISGGAGRDRMSGDRGDDTLFARDGQTDVLTGGAGIDTAQLDDELDRRSLIETLLA